MILNIYPAFNLLFFLIIRTLKITKHVIVFLRNFKWNIGFHLRRNRNGSKVPFEEDKAQFERFESLLEKFVSAPSDKVKGILKKEKKLKTRKIRPK